VNTRAVFPATSMRAGIYESFYLRAVSPSEPIGIWIRHTVHKAPGRAPRGSVWCTVFDARSGAPYMHKLTSERLGVPATGWIEVGEEAGEGGVLGPGRAEGRCGDARWSLRFSSGQASLEHLPRAWLYRAPVPRTKSTSPYPAALFDGVLELGGRSIELRSWSGMVGHNWGSEHAERWIWLDGLDFDGAPEAWLDVVLGRVKVAGRLTPWLANGALAFGDRRLRLGGLSARRVAVDANAAGAVLSLAGRDGLVLNARVRVPPAAAAGWRYSDPRGGDHDVVNCSVSELELEVRLPGETATRTLATAHGAAYELGMRERDHGVPIAPFSDG
jgi:hypothetical protein